MNSNSLIKLNTSTFYYVALKQNVLYEAWDVIYFESTATVNRRF
jgi:hypothetical protein